MKQTIIRFAILLFTVSFLQCDDADKKDNSLKNDSTTKSEKRNTDDGSKLVLLENNGIKIALPEGFKRISASEYQLFLEANYSKKTLEYEMDRARNLRNREGHFYPYLNEESASTLLINVVDPLDISADNPQGILNMITSTHIIAKKETQREYEKITAGFSDNEGISIFKALYKVKEKNKSNPMFEHSYIITNNDLSMLITLTTTEDINLDPYIEKIKL